MLCFGLVWGGGLVCFCLFVWDFLFVCLFCFVLFCFASFCAFLCGVSGDFFTCYFVFNSLLTLLVNRFERQTHLYRKTQNAPLGNIRPGRGFFRKGERLHMDLVFINRGGKTPGVD